MCTCHHCFRLTDCKITEVDRTDTLALWSWFFVTQSRDPAPVHKLTCHVCCQLIKMSNEIQTARKAMQSYLPQLIPLVIAASSEVCYMYYYHKLVGTFLSLQWNYVLILCLIVVRCFLFMENDFVYVWLLSNVLFSGDDNP